MANSGVAGEISLGRKAQRETWRVAADGHKDPTDTSGTFIWLLDDITGNVGTHVDDAGAVIEQTAYDPYGRPEKGGTSKKPNAPESSLGYQKALTDRTTGSVILGPRQCDPTSARFTSSDFYVASGLDMSLQTDELTANKYLFAAANPVAYSDDGHAPKKNRNCGKKDRLNEFHDRYNKCMETYDALPRRFSSASRARRDAFPSSG